MPTVAAAVAAYAVVVGAVAVPALSRPSALKPSQKNVQMLIFLFAYYKQDIFVFF